MFGDCTFLIVSPHFFDVLLANRDPVDSDRQENKYPNTKQHIWSLEDPKIRALEVDTPDNGRRV